MPQYQNTDTSLQRYSKINRHITYDDILKPDFAFRYNNALSTRYITADGKREEYNGDSGLDYVDKSNLNGETLEYITSKFGDDVKGGYIISGASGSNSYLRIMSEPVENTFDYEKIDVDSWYDDEINTKWGYTSVKSLLSNQLKQTKKASRAEVKDLTLSSASLVTTDSGDSNTLASQTSLVPFQAPIDSDKDGEYSDNITVSVIDCYMVTGDYSNLKNTGVKFDVNIKEHSPNASFHSFGSAIEFKSDTEMLAYIQDKLSDEKYDLSDMSVKAQRVVFSVPAVNETKYGIIGYMSAEDGIHKNLLCVRLHGESLKSGAYLTSFYYPTGINNGNLTYTDAVTSQGDFSDIKSTDKYTVKYNTETVSGYGENTYPVYVMTEDMVRSTFGKLSNSTLSNYTTGIVKTGVKLRNIKSVKLTVTDDSTGNKAESAMTVTAEEVSDNGLYYTRNGNKTVSELFSNTVNDSKNLFSNGGKKTITLTGVTSNDFTITILSVEFNKSDSYENYIHNKDFGRHDYTTDDGSTKAYEYVSHITPYNMKKPPVINWGSQHYAANSSYKSDGSFYLEDRYEKGETSYPSVISSDAYVTSEDNTTEKYTHTLMYPIIDSVGVVSVTNNLTNETVNSNLFVNGAAESIDMYVNYDDSNIRFTTSDGIFKIKKLKISVDGAETIVEPDAVSTSIYGLTIRVDEVHNSRLHITADDITKVPEGVIVIEPVIGTECDYSSDCTFQLGKFSIAPSYLSDSRLLNIHFDNTVSTSVISSSETELSEDVSVDYVGDIDYSLTADDTNHFYFYNVVSNLSPNGVISMTVPLYATLEKYEDGAWKEVFKSTFNNTVYSSTVQYDTGAKALDGKYRVKAQDYNTDHEDAKSHITYYDILITRTVRNKDVNIQFKKDDAITMELYNEIIDKQGNLSVVIKNMNGAYAELQQTKFYINEQSNESTYYKLAQGDYAIDVRIPVEYTAKVRIVGASGGSSEGYLKDNNLVKGKRILLPYANEQKINLEITLERKQDSVGSSDSRWGVSRYSSFYADYRNNNI